MAWTIIGQTANRRTLYDRIDSCVGYVPGNVQWVHRTVNFIKRDLPDDEFIEWCKQIAERSGTCGA